MKVPQGGMGGPQGGLPSALRAQEFCKAMGAHLFSIAHAYQQKKTL